MRTGSSVSASTSRVAVICEPATATTRPRMLSMRAAPIRCVATCRSHLCRSISNSAVQHLDILIEIGGLALPRQAAPIDCDRFDYGEDLASGSEAQRLAGAPGHPRKQAFAAEAELY